MIGFRLRTDKLLYDTYNSEMWCAGYIMNGGCSDDSFEYFRLWVISRGKDVYYAAKSNPDTLVSETSKDRELYDFEDFWYVAIEAFKIRTGKNLYDYIDYDNFVTREGKYPQFDFTWKEEDPASMKKICPKLFEKFKNSQSTSLFMKIIDIDLKEIRNKEQLLAKVGESLQFGNWSKNWDALNDSLCYLDKGGISGTSKILDFPMTINFVNCAELKRDDPESFWMLDDIFTKIHYKLKDEGKVMWINYKNVFCPCCGQTVCEEQGDYDICKVCGWENDLVQDKNSDMGGGANTRSLNEERKRFLERGPNSPRGKSSEDKI